jgi:MoaA/NifB/PqqE/SkfB family radical SAM enzyme
VSPAASPMVSGPRKTLAELRLFARIGWLACRSYKSLPQTARALRRLSTERTQHQRSSSVKCARFGGRYFWDFYVPGYPSVAFDRFIEGELDRVAPFRGAPPALQIAIVSITRRCPLRCEHCCEGSALNQPDALSLGDLQGIVARFQQRGVGQILLTGGEPLQRFDDILKLLASAGRETDFWLLTSGWGLTLEHAERLAEAGLTGVAVSLDHWDRDAHDRFRGRDGSYAWVERAAANARHAGLALCLSLCATRTFISRSNFDRYAQTARELGAGFIQILEPKAVGRYAGQDVALDRDQVTLVEDFTLRLNFDQGARDMPTVAYVESSTRRTHCVGAGDRYAYVDPDGHLHACPFCRTSMGRVLNSPLNDALGALRENGCRASSLPNGHLGAGTPRGEAGVGLGW